MNKEKQLLDDAASKLLGLALSSGAERAEVCASYGQRTKIQLEKQDFHLASADDGFHFGVRVLLGQRQGFASCNSTDPKDLKEVALRAVEIAGFSPQNPHYGIEASANLPDKAPACLWDEALARISVQTQKEWTKNLLEEALRDPRFRLNEGGLTLGSGAFLVVNSQGTHKLRTDGEVSWSLMGMAVEGDNITSFDYFQHMARHLDGLTDAIRNTTRSFRDKIVANLKQGKAKSYKGLVVFSPRACLDILFSALTHHVNGRSVVEATGKWKVADLGKQILSPLVSMSDEPWLTDRVGCAAFDREGTPTQARSLIEKGVLKNFLLDGYAAKALNLKSTGHAQGGPGGIPSVGPFTLKVSGGTEPLASLLTRARQQQNEILVLDRYSGQTDPITGDFSGVAKGGEWWVNGERAYCVKETLVAGNLFDVLGKQLFGVSKETEVIDSAEECPTILADGVSVTGG